MLNPFDQDNFMGDWKTKTYGSASVFNLMTKENYHGDLIHLDIPPKKQVEFEYEASLNKDLVAICFYVAHGSFKTTINNKVFKVNHNDLLLTNCTNSNFAYDFIFSNDSLDITNIIVSIIYRS